MGRRTRLLSIATPELTPEEKLQNLNAAIEAIRNNEINKLVATIPLGVDIKAIYSMKKVNPLKREVVFSASLLHVAIWNNSVESSKFLLHLGAPKDVPESSLGDTPLHLALRHGCRDIFNILLDYNANIDSTNRRGDTPLHIAARKGDIHSVNALLQEGALPYPRNRYDETPYYVAMIEASPKSLSCAQLIFAHHPLTLTPRTERSHHSKLSRKSKMTLKKSTKSS